MRTCRTTHRDRVGTRAAVLFAALALPLTLAFAPGAAADAAAVNRALGAGVNLGNALEAPSEGKWGLTLEAGFFDLVADAGYDSVRVPIRWSAHAMTSAPYTIDEGFFERVDWVLAQARRTGLAAIVNLHHYDALMANSRAERARFLALWAQIARRYASEPDGVAFELLNEPHGVFNDDPALWNALFADALERVRRSNPERAVLVGPVGWQSVGRLDELVLPDDPNLILSVHVYEPFAFTHQGASWVQPTPPTGERWFGGRRVLAEGVQDWSWGTDASPGVGAFGVTFARRYAAFSPRLATPLAAPRTLRLRLRGEADLSIGCAADGGDFRYVDRVAHAGGAWTTLVADLADCPAGTVRLALQNEGAGGAAFEIGSAFACERRCRPIVTSARQAVVGLLREARDRGAREGVPVNVGEYGAYGAADDPSRVRWTRAVRDAAREAGLSTHYWEFGAGFGVYDPARGVWRRALLDATLR